MPVSGTYYTINGLNAGASYLVGVKTVFSSTASSAFSSDASFTTTGGSGGGCQVPAGLAISGVTSNAASASSFALSGLKAGTLYETKVRTRCPVTIRSDMSNNVEFTSLNKAGAVSAGVHPIAEEISFSVTPTIARDRIYVKYEGAQVSEGMPFTIYSMQGAAM